MGTYCGSHPIFCIGSSHPFPELDRVDAEMLPSSSVRYAAVLAGDFQLVVDVVFPSRAALSTYLKGSEWATRAQAIEPAVVVDAPKTQRNNGTVTWRRRVPASSCRPFRFASIPGRLHWPARRRVRS